MTPIAYGIAKGDEFYSATYCDTLEEAESQLTRYPTALGYYIVQVVPYLPERESI